MEFGGGNLMHKDGMIFLNIPGFLFVMAVYPVAVENSLASRSFPTFPVWLLKRWVKFHDLDLYNMAEYISALRN